MSLPSLGKGEISFTRDVMPVLSKAGCNGGGCHGNQNGKGGFKLSLWGERPSLDYENILSSKKRANLENPQNSKLLSKPTLIDKHEGGKRFEIGSEEYRILHDWLKSGAKNDINSSPTLESISIMPPYVSFRHLIRKLVYRLKPSLRMVKKLTSQSGQFMKVQVLEQKLVRVGN